MPAVFRQNAKSSSANKVSGELTRLRKTRRQKKGREEKPLRETRTQNGLARQQRLGRPRAQTHHLLSFGGAPSLPCRSAPAPESRPSHLPGDPMASTTPSGTS